MDSYKVKTIGRKDEIIVEVPGSKSITNRSLMLAAMGHSVCTLKGVLFSDDSRAFLSCLIDLGFDVKINETDKEVIVKGTGGLIPNRQANINVCSAGTAARFLTVMLSAAGGAYTLNSSEQMKKRPMKELLNALEDAGINIEFIEKEGHFPFRIISEGLKTKEFTIDTTTSSQYASALLMAASITDGLTINMTGNRTNGSYINITLTMMKQFGIDVKRVEDTCVVNKSIFGIDEYRIEPDVSAACYFYAMAPILKSKVIVKNVYLESMQGDIKFVNVMNNIGCEVSNTPNGICVNGNNLNSYNGVDLEMKDFSDQTMTMAVVAVFANTETVIRNVGHIRLQESDRIKAIVTELRKMGIDAIDYKENEKENIRIIPGIVKPSIVDTYDDHRIAMAFTLVGLRCEGIVIDNPMCCRKTFEDYFDIINEITN